MRYIVSGDTSFQKIGTKTKINYWHDFRQYLHFFAKHAGSDLVKDIYGFFNTKVFADIYKAGDAEEIDIELSGDELENFEADLQAERVLEGDESEDEGDAGSGGHAGADFDEFETGGHGSYMEEDDFFDHGASSLDITDLSPPRGNTLQTQPRTHNTNTNSTPESSYGLVPPEASRPRASETEASAEALRLRPRVPPMVISAKTRAPSANTISHSGHSMDQPPVRGKAGNRAPGPGSQSTRDEVAVLETVEEETHSAIRQTRASSSTLTKTTTTTRSAKQKAGDKAGTSAGGDVVSQPGTRTRPGGKKKKSDTTGC